MFETEEQHEVEMQVDVEEQDVAAAEVEEETVEVQEGLAAPEAQEEPAETEAQEEPAETEAQEEPAETEAQEAGERVEGTVKWFSNPKGYGFISREGGEDVFVHYSEIQGSGFRSLSAGERVEFTVRQSEKGPRAAEVRSLETTVGAGWL
jgi:CspA family cold shock protein